MYCRLSIIEDSEVVGVQYFFKCYLFGVNAGSIWSSTAKNV